MPMASSALCIYCNQRPGNHPDHIPPKNVFPSPRPANLITVPACQECNSAFSLDDEYFRFAIVARRDLQDNPIVKQLNAEVFKGLDRPHSAGFRQGFIDHTRVAEGGLQMLADCDRINRVAARIVRGLHFREFAKLLPAANVDSFYDGSFDPSGMQAIFPLTSILESVRQEPPKIAYSNIFEYRVTTIEGKPDGSAWLLTFFNRAWFLALANWC